MKKHLIALSTAMVLLAHGAIQAQGTLVEHVFLGSRSKFELQVLFNTPVEYDINLYRILYVTQGTDNLPDTASGLLVTPVAPGETEFPIVVYGHGTTPGPTDVPSLLRGGYEVPMGYAAKGFIAVAPDYLGLGTSRGFHPYIHAATEASASFDMLLASMEYLENNPLAWNPLFLFISGYSQGGHTGAALHKYMETYFPFMPITAATHMSGPYNLSGIMRDQVLSDEPYAYPAYIAYIVLGYQEVYDSFPDFTEVFKEPYLTNITNFYNGTINLTTLNNQLLTLLLNNHGSTVSKAMMHDSIVDLMENDMDYILNEVLHENDLHNWAPIAPTLLYYCGGDTQVPHENALIAEDTMQALGATDVAAVQINANFDHGPCVFPSVLSSINYFKALMTAIGIPDVSDPDLQVSLQPNPATDKIAIAWETANAGMDYIILNGQGQVIRHGRSANNTIDITSLASGLYNVVISAGAETRIARFLRS